MGKILILRPAGTATGGISNYYDALRDEFDLPVEFFLRGARNWPNKDSKINEFYRFIKDNVNFLRRLLQGDVQIIQTSTSLGSLSVIRDGIFLWIAQIMGVKTIVFYRGWDENFEEELKQKYFPLFKKVFLSTDCSIVLSEGFKNKLISWGYDKPIYVETTIVDSSLFDNIDFDILQRRKERYKQSGAKNFLFLARIEIEKGIYETLKAFKKASEIHQNITLTIAGDGNELAAAKKFTEENNISNVFFIGFVSGAEKQRVFLEADVYLFPSYSEGMPNSVLEAMAFGLPVIYTKVGGLEDIMIDRKTGLKVSSQNDEDLKNAILSIINDSEAAYRISENNIEMARQRFMSSVVANRIESIYKKYL